jgi:hypothetical protein
VLTRAEDAHGGAVGAELGDEWSHLDGFRSGADDGDDLPLRHR